MKTKAVLAVALLFFVSSAAAEAADTGPGTSSSSATQTISLDPGWNSVSFDIEGLSFSEDIKPQCSFNWYNQDLSQEDVSPSDISEDEKYYVWTQEGGGWSHPDSLQVRKGYTLNVDSECDLELSGETKQINKFRLEDGWNLVNLPSDLSIGTITSECSLRWYNQDLSEGVSAEKIDKDKRYYMWVRGGDNWRNPDAGDSRKNNDGVYINSDGSCEIGSDSWSDGSDSSDSSSPSDDSDGDSSDDSDTEDTKDDLGEVPDREIDYSVEKDWDFSEKEIAALAGVPRGYIGSRFTDKGKISLKQLIKDVREFSVDNMNWQYGASECLDVNPEECSYSGNTFYVSSQEGWVLDPGTPAPGCYHDNDYVPPKYGRFSDEVDSNVPRVDASKADAEESDECPSWLTDDVLESLDNATSSATGERFNWKVIKQPDSPEVDGSYEVNYKIEDSRKKLSGVEIKVEYKHKDADADDWVKSQGRTCEEESDGGNPSYCYTSVEGDRAYFIPQKSGTNVVRVSLTTEDGVDARHKWEYSVSSSN